MTLPLVIGAICLGVVLGGLRRLPQNSVFTLSRFGRYRRTLGPGWHWVLPGLDRLGNEVSLIGHHLRVPDADAFGEAELYYQILDPEKVGATLDNVDSWVAEQTRDVLKLGGVSPEQVQLELNKRFGAHGLRVIRCSLRMA